MDAEAIRASMPREPIYGSTAADRIAEQLGTPNQPDARLSVTTFLVRRLIDLELLTDLSGNSDYELLNPDQVDEVCRRSDLPDLVHAHAGLGSDQAAERLGVRRRDFDRIHKDLKWVEPVEWREVRLFAGRAGRVDVPLFRAADIDAVPAQHPEVDWPAVRATAKGRPSPLTALAKATLKAAT
ncbi:hypothetical protein CTZ27_29980 [Streptomyces griseocarneus]|nr:hypothetical protein CTZ27_29980 [Streptomyces griseocarneus]